MINLKLQKPGYLNLFYTYPGKVIFGIYAHQPINDPGKDLSIGYPQFEISVFLKFHPNFQLLKLIKAGRLLLGKHALIRIHYKKITITGLGRNLLKRKNNFQTFFIFPKVN